MPLTGYHSAPRALVAAAVCGAAVGCAATLATLPAGAASACQAGPASGAAVAWTPPPGADDATRLAAWCAAVGAPVVAGAPPPTSAGVDSLAVVTWNVHGGGGDVERLAADLRAGRLTGGAPVREFVLLLQEAHRVDATLPPPPPHAVVPRGVAETPPAGERVGIVETARRLGLSIAYVPSMRNGDAAPAEDRGNAVLSTLPISEVGAVVLPFEAQRRVAVTAAVHGRGGDGAGWRLRVASVHLDTRSVGARLWATLGAGRLRQARSLAAALSDEGAVVVGGDLNTWSLSSLEDALPYLRSAFDDTPAPPPGPTFRTAWGFERRLDHMFFRLPGGWSARYGRLDDRYGSDHYPLLAWVRFRAPAPAPVAATTGP